MRKILDPSFDTSRVRDLRGKEADDFLNLTLKVVDKLRLLVEEEDRRDLTLDSFKATHQFEMARLVNAHYLTISVSEASGVLPSSLTISGVAYARSKEPLPVGVSSDIYQCLHYGCKVAVKRRRVYRSFNLEWISIVRRCWHQEALLWRGLSHPHILPFLGVDIGQPDMAFEPGVETELFVTLVSPWMEHGTLTEYLKTTGSLSTDVDTLLLEVALGLRYLHSRQIIHGNLTPANIYIDDAGHVRLAEFGLSVFRQQGHDECRVSPRFMAPELLRSSGITPASDIYSFSLVCVEAYTLQRPFPDVKLHVVAISQVLHGKRPGRPPRDPSKPMMSDSLWSLIQWCWEEKPTNRPTIGSVIASLRLCKEIGR
ncbi:hypothetical protein JAAARDRAFT_247031 [Jaapia argillacea MUCL 33604]|uniref:Protein kinase domain-containing protein n=1 Tax=Jaapia argillacea MUCL 33604 TaxID=933084 RepID=A0A067QFV7_9AGAM|nr:hypothetical protein JAAARDRAFT_247031 [Jaapia argillacea MUCL 33604]